MHYFTVNRNIYSLSLPPPSPTSFIKHTFFLVLFQNIRHAHQFIASLLIFPITVCMATL